MSCPRSKSSGGPGEHAGRRTRQRRLAFRTAALGLLLPVCAGGSAVAETPRPRADALWTEEAPKIDGLLDEPAWQAATPLPALLQVEPRENVPPTRNTIMKILVDEDNLYVGVRAEDPDPGSIIARNMQRDGDLTKEDRFGFLLDPFLDRRNGYFFQTNPLGARLDGLIEDARLLLEWDGIWNVKTTIDSKGWTAEFVIPFKTLNFPEGRDVWGINLLRGIRGAEENTRWAEPFQNRDPIDPSAGGTLHGMAGARQGIGLDVVPASSVRRVDDSRRLTGEAEPRHFTRYQPSGDVRYKLTPSLTLTGTANTDFGQTPADDVQVNLGPARLFFPERRDFFLQDKGIFDFGNIDQDAQPFFSRRIGLNGGDEVPIRGGAKLTGRVGPLNVGLLGVRQGRQSHDRKEDDVSPKTLGVARLKLNVGEESTVGAIGTFGDPRTDGGNWLVGGDLNYRTSRLFGDKVLQAHAWYQHSHSYGSGATCRRRDGSERDCDQENAFGIRMIYPNDRVNWAFVVQDIQEDFRPALGFVARDNTRRLRGSWRYRWRPEEMGSVRTIDASTFGFVLTESDRPDVVTEASFAPSLPDFTTDEGDRFRTFMNFQYLRELQDRKVFDDVTLVEGRYFFTNGGFEITASRSRKVSGLLLVSGGEYFSGYQLGFDSQLRYEPIPQLVFALTYSHRRHWGLERGDPPNRGNSFNVRIATARAEVQLSPDVSWSNLVQYDNASDDVNIQSRFRWTITPGSDVFLILNQGFVQENGAQRAGRTEPIAKIAWTFRF